MNALDQRILLFFSLNSSCNQQFVIFEIAFFSLDGLFSIRDHLIFSRELFVYPSKYYLFTYTPRAIWTFESMNSQEHYHMVRNAGQQPPKLKRPVSCKPACFVVIAFMGIIDNQNITKKVTWLRVQYADLRKQGKITKYKISTIQQIESKHYWKGGYAIQLWNTMWCNELNDEQQAPLVPTLLKKNWIGKNFSSSVSRNGLLFRLNFSC